MAVNPGYVLLFDRDCGICRALGRWIARVDVRRRIRFQTIQAAGSLLREIPQERLLDAFHMVSPGGRVSTGGDAVPTLIEAFPIGAGFARILRGSTTLMSAVRAGYGFLTRFRDRLVCRLDSGAPSADSGL